MGTIVGSGPTCRNMSCPTASLQGGQHATPTSASRSAAFVARGRSTVSVRIACLSGTSQGKSAPVHDGALSDAVGDSTSRACPVPGVRPLELRPARSCRFGLPHARRRSGRVAGGAAQPPVERCRATECQRFLPEDDAVGSRTRKGGAALQAAARPSGISVMYCGAAAPMSSPGVEPGLRPSQGRVRSPTLRGRLLAVG